MSENILTGPSRPRHVSTLIAAILSAVARSVLATAAALLLWAAIPAVWGWVPTTVMSDSMAPGIRTGDVVVAMPADIGGLTTGQVLLVHDPDHPDRLRFHRFVGFNEAGQVVLKGDANQQVDSSPVERTEVIGVGVIRVPSIGLPVVWLREAQFLPLVSTVAVLMLLAFLVRLDPTRALRATPSTSSGLSGGRSLSARRRTVGIAAGIAMVAMAGTGLALVVLQPSGAAFSKSTPNPRSTLNAAATYDCFTGVAPDSPFFFYRYSERTGTSVADSSGNSRTGTTRGTTTRVAGTCAANATPSLTLNGSSGYVSIPTNVSGTDTFTVEIWFRTTTARGGRMIGFGDTQTGTSTTTDRHIYMSNTGRLVFGVAPGDVKQTITSARSYNDGVWHHAAATLSSAGMALYVDGASVASNSAITTARVGTGFWRIGNDTLAGWVDTPTSNFFAGTIDGTAAYTSALTAGTISAHYTAGR